MSFRFCFSTRTIFLRRRFHIQISRISSRCVFMSISDQQCRRWHFSSRITTANLATWSQDESTSRNVSASLRRRRTRLKSGRYTYSACLQVPQSLSDSSIPCEAQQRPRTRLCWEWLWLQSKVSISISIVRWSLLTVNWSLLSSRVSQFLSPFILFLSKYSLWYPLFLHLFWSYTQPSSSQHCTSNKSWNRSTHLIHCSNFLALPTILISCFHIYSHIFHHILSSCLCSLSCCTPFHLRMRAWLFCLEWLSLRRYRILVFYFLKSGLPGMVPVCLLRANFILSLPFLVRAISILNQSISWIFSLVFFALNQRIILCHAIRSFVNVWVCVGFFLSLLVRLWAKTWASSFRFAVVRQVLTPRSRF